MNKKEQLRFAALRRVSTEQQEKVGESLRTQTTDMEEVTASLGGIIVEWYGGQEHATPGHEKEEVQRLLRNAQKETRKFNAVLVAHPDRWSRDNSSNRAGLEVFKGQGIRFFAGATEYDLFNPDHELFLGISAVVGQFTAHNQKRKSLLNRINRAKRGVPTGGRLPFGRNFIRSADRQTGEWQIDTEKQKMIQDCAKRYLAGEAMDDLAKEYHVNGSNLHKVLTKVSGTQWQIEFDSPDLNIHEIVEIKIPELLDDKVIAAIRKKAKLNRTYQHGKIVHKYLFSMMMSCSHCGYAMIGQTNHGNRQYYRHIHAERDRTCPGAERKTWIPARQIEDAVMRHLFETFGNPSAVQQAIKEATPNDEGIQEAVGRLERTTKELEKLKASRKRILDWSVKGTIPDDEATAKLEELKEREQKLNDEKARLDDELAHLPSREKIKNISKIVAGKFRRYASAKLAARARHANRAFEAMTWNDRRELCEMVFSGETMDGRRMGVWITWSEDGKKWQYRIEGLLIDETGPINPKWFDFGAAHLQKELVAESALR